MLADPANRGGMGRCKPGSEGGAGGVQGPGTLIRKGPGTLKRKASHACLEHAQ